jgi:hypothetical protein
MSIQQVYVNEIEVSLNFGLQISLHLDLPLDESWMILESSRDVVVRAKNCFFFSSLKNLVLPSISADNLWLT